MTEEIQRERERESFLLRNLRRVNCEQRVQRRQGQTDACR
jgi:hypothetical protein